jgi:excisionase family DNA binding protein
VTKLDHDNVGKRAKTLAEFPDPMKPSHLARLWTISTDTVIAMCESGEIEAFRIRKHWRIYKSAVVEYVKRVKEDVAS